MEQDFPRAREYDLSIAGVPITDYVEELTYGPSEDAPAHILSVRLVGYPNQVQEQDEVLVTLDGNTDFRGRVMFRAGEGQELLVEAATGSRWRGKELLGEMLALDNHHPSRVAADMCSRLPYSGLGIPHLPDPPMSHKVEDEEDNRFDRYDSVKDVLEVVEEESGLVILDSEHNVAVGYKEDPLEEAGEIAARLVVGVDIEPPFEPEPAYEDRYSAVEVYERREDGEVEVLARVPVEYRDPGTWASEGAILPLESTDKTPEKYRTAGERARKEADRIGGGELSVSCTVLSLDRRIRRTATVLIEHEDFYSGRVTEYAAVIKTHERDPLSQTTRISARLTVRSTNEASR